MKRLLLQLLAIAVTGGVAPCLAVDKHFGAAPIRRTHPLPSPVPGVERAELEFLPEVEKEFLFAKQAYQRAQARYREVKKQYGRSVERVLHAGDDMRTVAKRTSRLETKEEAGELLHQANALRTLARRHRNAERRVRTAATAYAEAEARLARARRALLEDMMRRQVEGMRAARVANPESRAVPAEPGF